MYYSNEIIRQMQDNKILALQLDHAVAGVGDLVKQQLEQIGAGATRLLYYTSCFTQEYHDVCAKQKIEDTRFKNGIFHLIKERKIIFSMVRIYVELLLQYRTTQQLKYIEQLLMKANVHIATSTLTNQAFTLGVTMSICLGMNIGIKIRNRISRTTSTAVGLISIYGIVQEAAESAQRLQLSYPKYYHALYMHELEMMYFLIEPTFIRANVLNIQQPTDEQIAKIITNMVR